MEKNYCNKCGNCCKNIVVDFNQNIIFRDGIQKLDSEFAKMLEPVKTERNITFCNCKFLIDNLCTNPEKPDFCLKYPSSPFAFLPKECGYYGVIFLKKEQIMQKIRKLKEEIINYEALLVSASKQDYREYSIIIERHKNFISKYAQYGALDW